jgi:conjugative relaxase-like TrwC/TraI family protein
MVSIEMLDFEQAAQYFESFAKICRIDGQDGSFYGGKANKLIGESVIEHTDSFPMFLSHNDNAAINLTFSAPKSFSVLLELTDNSVLRDKLIEMHDNSVCKTTGYIENNLIVTRVSKGKDFRGKRVNDLVSPDKGIEWAAFSYHASSENDPHLYTNVVIANRIYIKGEKYSIDARDLFKYLIALGKMYRAELYNELQAGWIGVKITDYKNFFFAIEGISEETIHTFSKQSKNIDKAFMELMSELPDEPEARLKEFANLESRPDQGRTETLEEIRTRWKEESPQKHVNYIEKPVILANMEDAAEAAAEAAGRLQPLDFFSDLDFRNLIKQIIIFKGLRFDETIIQAAFKTAVKKRLVKEIDKHVFTVKRG